MTLFFDLFLDTDAVFCRLWKFFDFKKSFSDISFKLILIKHHQILIFRLQNFLNSREVNDNLFIEDIRRAIQIIIFNHFRSIELDSQLNRRLFESNLFYDIRQRSTFIKSIYIINWTVNNFKLRHDIKTFVLNTRHLLKFIDESIDITSQTFFNDNSKNFFETFRANRRQHFSSKKKQSS